MVEIVPGILEKDWSEIEKKLEITKSFAKTIHIDILDGKFAPNITFLDPVPFSKYSRELFLELHMMVEDPIQYLEPFAKAGFKRFIGHIEKMSNQTEFVIQAKKLGEVGLAIDGPTPLEDIEVPFSDLDSILIMTIKAGQSGQTFNKEYLKKIEMLKLIQHDNGETPIIEVDGGINDKIILSAKNSGATRFVSNSFIFNAQNPQEQYNLLKNIVERPASSLKLRRARGGE